MVDTCVSTLFADHNGSIPLYTDNIIMLSIFIIIAILLRLLVYHLENFDVAPPPLTKDAYVSYGLGAKNVVKTMSMTLIALSTPIIVIYYIFRIIPGDSSKEFACQIQFGFLFVQVAIFSSVNMIVATNYLRLYTRYTFANTVADFLKPVISNSTNTTTGSKTNEGDDVETGIEEVGRIVVLPAYRGVWVAPFCNIFAEHCKSSGIKHEAYTFDCFESVYNNESDSWLRHVS